MDNTGDHEQKGQIELLHWMDISQNANRKIRVRLLSREITWATTRAISDALKQ